LVFPTATVLRGSDAGDELDASFHETAEEPVLAWIAPVSGRQASRRLLFALPKEKSSIFVAAAGAHRDASG
jgi:hypothetical protein